MSDTIDEVLNNLNEKLEGGGNIKMEVVEDFKDDVKEVSKEATKSEKKTMRKKLAELSKLAGKEPKEGGPSRAPGKGKNAKANPRPPNVNPDGVRCYIRYNSMGVPYRTCNDGKGKKPRKPPSQITPSQTPEEFAEQHGGYANLTKGQTQEYHKLWMREKRADDRKVREGGEEILRLQQQLLREEKEKVKLDRLEKKLKQAEKVKLREEYKEAEKDLIKQFGTRKNVGRVRFRELREKYNQKTKKQDINVDEIKEELDAQKEIYSDIQESIVDGKKKIRKSYGGIKIKEDKKGDVEEVVLSFE